MSLRLPVGRVTVLLGRGLARRRVMLALDDSTGRTEAQHAALVRRLTAGEDDPVAARRRALDEVLAAGTPIVLVDRLTDGLRPEERRSVLARLRDVAAAGSAVLVDDADPVAALAVADDALRIDPERGLVLSSVGDEVDYLAS